MYAVNIKVIKVGTCTVDPGNMVSGLGISLKYQLGIGGGSTVALVYEGKDVLLVDTGYEHESDVSQANGDSNWQSLESHLKSHHFSVRDITKVFITHFHQDHFRGIERLEHAQWYCHQLARERLDDALKPRFTPLEDGELILPNTRVLHTPGHTEGHASVLWWDEKKRVRVAICGDAILSLAWLQSGYTWRFNHDFFDHSAARASVERLLAASDLLIPGHGEPFWAQSAQMRICGEAVSDG